MRAECLPAFIEEFIKIAGAAERAAEKVDAHLQKPDWKAFQKALGSKSFQDAVLKNSKSDEKLKLYAKNVGDYALSKEVVGKEPSRTSKKSYSIRKLPSGRLGCGCNDWRYVHSIKDTDCDHIKALKAKKEELVKRANIVLDVNRSRLLSGEPLVALHLRG